MRFLLRLLFPKTSQLEDYAASLREKDRMIQSLLDAVVAGKGQERVFEKRSDANSPSRIVNPFNGDAEAWRQNSLLQENERIIEEAFTDEEAYTDLYNWVIDGRAGAAELLREVDARLARLKVEQERMEAEFSGNEIGPN